MGSREVRVGSVVRSRTADDMMGEVRRVHADTLEVHLFAGPFYGPIIEADKSNWVLAYANSQLAKELEGGQHEG